MYHLHIKKQMEEAVSRLTMLAFIKDLELGLNNLSNHLDNRCQELSGKCFEDFITSISNLKSEIKIFNSCYKFPIESDAEYPYPSLKDMHTHLENIVKDLEVLRSTTVMGKEIFTII